MEAVNLKKKLNLSNLSSAIDDLLAGLKIARIDTEVVFSACLNL